MLISYTNERQVTNEVLGPARERDTTHFISIYTNRHDKTQSVISFASLLQFLTILEVQKERDKGKT